jgi:hypothetical protein
MTQPLRSVHRRAFVGLTVVLPAILLVGLAARRRPRPSAIAAQMPGVAQLVMKSDSLWKKHAIQSQFYRDPSKHDIYVVLLPARALNDPDVLLYWAANLPQGGSLPTDAQLVGSFAAGKAFVLPSSAEPGGHLVLFSLAHQALVDTATVEKLP